jgi:T5orf172 domain
MPPSYPSPPNTPSPARVLINGELARRNERFTTRAGIYAPPTPPTTPSNNGSIVAVKAMPVPAPMDPEALKTLLRLGTGKCGSPTQYEGNPPCRRYNPSNIESQIESMTTLTQASPELPAQLAKLAELALCKDHRRTDRKAARIKDWTKVFPVGDEEAVPIEPIEDQIRSVLDCFPYTSAYTCIGKNRYGTRCGIQIGGNRVRKGKRTVALIIEPENYSNKHNLTFLLNVLAFIMFCHHHQEQIPDWVVEQESRIKTIYRAYPIRGRPLRSTSNTGLAHKFRGDPADFWDDADDTSAFITEIEEDRPSDCLACYSLVRDKMMEPLKEPELDDGHVYVYEVEGNKGFVKIGFTTKTIKERSAEWKSQCDRAPRVLYPLGHAKKIRHANRVEALCLAELKYRNITVICEACPKRHIEWVEVPAAEAIAVIQKWTKWIGTAPYEDSKRRLTSGELKNKITSWTLRYEERQRTGDMPKFMQEIVLASLSAGNQSSRRETSEAVFARNRSSRQLEAEVLAAIYELRQMSSREISEAVPTGRQRSRREASEAVSTRNESSRQETLRQSSRKETSGAMPARRENSRREILGSVSAGRQNSRRGILEVVSAGRENS